MSDLSKYGYNKKNTCCVNSDCHELIMNTEEETETEVQSINMRMHLLMPSDIVEKIDTTARRKRMKRSEFLRFLIMDGLDRYNKK